ncbi:MAG: 2TM domain-containing protein [Deltaproteobacteria bacterium]|nr:2TM domain-containing protein [Deltaproteobacteria bacterium]
MGDRSHARCGGATSVDMTERRYTTEQVRDILRRAERERSGAQETPDDLSERELFETAKELGLDAAKVERAIGEIDREGELATALRDIRAERRSALRSHLFAFFIVNATLAFIDVRTGGPSWVIWPFFFWSLWLIVHVVAFVTPNNDKLVKRAERRVRSKRWRERGKKLGRKIEQSVGALIDRATDEPPR